MTFYGDFLTTVGKRWDSRWSQRAIVPPTGAQPLSPSAIGRLIKHGVVQDVLVASLLLISLFLGWAGMTRLLLAAAIFRALSWCLVWAIINKNRQLGDGREGAD